MLVASSAWSCHYYITTSVAQTCEAIETASLCCKAIELDGYTVVLLSNMTRPYHLLFGTYWASDGSFRLVFHGATVWRSWH